MVNAMRNKTTNIYTEWLPLIETLTDEQAGIIFKSILQYQNGCDVSCENPIWLFIKSKIDNYNEDLRNKSNFRSEAGRLGGLAKASNAKQNVATPSKPSIKENKIKEKKIKENNMFNDEFESFWLLYPKKQSKAEALKSFTKALNKTNLDTILTGLNNYLFHINKEKTELKFIKHPTTWLNQECWNDDYGISNKTKTGRPLHGFEKQAIEEGRKVTSKIEIEMIKEWCRDNGYDETLC
jgi:hypothetical protein